MKQPEIPANESDRQAALDRYKILDTLPEQVYDELTQLASDICGTPIALISLIDNNRQWFKSNVGLEVTETSRDISFCGHAVAAKAILNVPDASKDSRFADNPLVVDDPNIRFYVGIPLITEDSFALGTLCVIDRQPHNLTDLQIRQLEALSRLVISQFELRRKEDTVKARTNELHQAIADLQQENQQRLKTEVSLRESQKLFTSLAAAAPVGIFRTDVEGRCIYVNERWLQISGLALSEATGFGWLDGIHPSDRELVSTEWKTSVTENRPFSLEYRFKNNSGQTTWGYGQAVAERDQFGETIGYVGTITDISDRKQAEASLQQLNQELETKVEERTQALWQINSLHQAILDGADYALISTDLNGVIQTFNKAAERMLGYSASELIGQFTPAIIHDPQEVVNRAATLSLELGQNIPVGFEVLVAKARLGMASEDEWTYICQDGSRFPVLLSITALKDANQEIIGFLGIAQDISDRKQAEQEILESQKFIQKIAEASPNILYLYDLQEHCNVYSNREIASVLGYSTTEIQAMGSALFANLMHPEDLAKMPDYYQQMDTSQDREIFEIEYRMRHANGEWRWLYSRDTVFSRDDRGQIKLTIGTAQDISDRKQAEQQLKQQLTAIESAVDGIAILKDDCYVYLNSSHVNLFGYDHPQDLLGKNWRMLYASEELQRIQREVFPVLGEHRHWEGEAIAIRKDGTTFTEGLSLTLTEDNLLICVCRDVSARKEAERKLQQTTAQLEASNQELEAFAYSVSHDLRSPLRAIDGFSNALIEDYGDRFDDDAKDYFDRIRRNIQRMGMLIDDLLRLSRVSRSEMQYTTVNLSALVQEQIDELQAINPERQVKFAIAPNIIVSADRTLMQVVISNLVQNAWKFTSHHDSALIEFGVLQQEDHLTYFMRDDGAGFNMKFAKMLFGVFQRLHDTNEFAGTGIGLATVQRAIHRHGGRVWAEGSVEQGATIYFTVPNTAIKKGA